MVYHSLILSTNGRANEPANMVYNQQNNQLVVATFAHDASFTQALSKLGQSEMYQMK